MSSETELELGDWLGRRNVSPIENLGLVIAMHKHLPGSSRTVALRSRSWLADEPTAWKKTMIASMIFLAGDLPLREEELREFGKAIPRCTASQEHELRR